MPAAETKIQDMSIRLDVEARDAVRTYAETSHAVCVPS